MSAHVLGTGTIHTVFYYTFYGLNLLCYLGVSMHLQCKFLSERKSDVYLEYKVQYLKGT